MTRTILFRRVLVAPAAYLCLTLLAGCAAPAKVQPSPHDTLLGRTLYDTPYAFVYASSDSAASQTVADLNLAAREFQKTVRSPPSKGLILVSDAQDLPYSADSLLVCRLITQEEHARGAGRAGAEPITADKLGRAGQKIGKDLLHRVLLARCGSIEPDEAARLFDLRNRPAGDACWCIVAPTTAAVQKVSREVLDKAMSQPNVPVAARLMIAPLGPLVEARAGGQVSANRQVAFYAAMTQHDRHLALTARTSLATSFAQRKQQTQRNSPLTAALKDMQNKTAAQTQPTEGGGPTR